MASPVDKVLKVIAENRKIFSLRKKQQKSTKFVLDKTEEMYNELIKYDSSIFPEWLRLELDKKNWDLAKSGIMGIEIKRRSPNRLSEKTDDLIKELQTCTLQLSSCTQQLAQLPEPQPLLPQPAQPQQPQPTQSSDLKKYLKLVHHLRTELETRRQRKKKFEDLVEKMRKIWKKLKTVDDRTKVKRMFGISFISWDDDKSALFGTKVRKSPTR